MSNLPPNPFNTISGPPLANDPTQHLFNHNQQFGQVPSSQLPPGYSGLKQDANSNSPYHTSAPVQNNIQNVNNYSQSGNSSPAFNQPGIPFSSAQPGIQAMRPLTTAPTNLKNPIPPSLPRASSSPRTVPNMNPSPNPYPPKFQPQQNQINDNTPPLVPSSHFSQPVINGPKMSAPPGPMSNPFPPSSAYNPTPLANRPPPVSNAAFAPGPIHPGPITSIAKPPGPAVSHPNVPFAAPLSGPARNSPLPLVPPVSGPATGPIMKPPLPGMINGPQIGAAVSGTQLGPPRGPNALPTSSNSIAGPPMSGQAFQPYSGPPRNGPSQPMAPGQPPGPPSMAVPPSFPSGPSSLSGHPSGLPSGYPGPPSGFSGPQSLPPMGMPPVHQQGPPISGVRPPVGPTSPSGPSNMQNRYPQMPSSNYANHQPQMPQQPGTAPPYNMQGMSQQMGQLSVTKQGFDQLWGHQSVDLLQCRHIFPEFEEDPPEIKLGHQFADSPNCSLDIFRCTLNRIPETNSLLQKSRLPLGILIHPFKDLDHLPVIQCSTIVRCRACRTYINPFVYFVDAKRWKCNLCYRVNDLPEEFQYDPVSKSYGDPSRRPEIKSATIEFIAPGEYMLRPPQPAVYLFLFDVSQLARESGYLQVACDTLKANLDSLPGDARTQVGFVCYDAHVHYYLMSDGLTRPKEMTVIDVDDVFLPSPESLLVNLGERRELVRELLTVLPQRYSAPGVPASALGAALQAAYKLMSPTGGRITVFQTCLPNVGPGALQSREDPNARSSKDVAHLNPATDFYKRIALDCSGAQIAVDLFLLNSQYADLASLSGMSKFSAGTVHHVPLFRAARGWQAAGLARALARYLTRKVGFEAVMRVRATRGIAIHTFHGNFFVRSTDLLSLPNVSPDAGFGMQLTIDESLADLQQVCFQAALLYTSSKGERRIRVHTLALPLASNLTEVLHNADQQAIIGLVSKMAADRCVSASLGEAREALINVAIDALSAHRLAQNLPAGNVSSALHAPMPLRLLPLYILALLKRKAFRAGTSTRLDDRVADMCNIKCLPLDQLMLGVYPALYPVHALRELGGEDDEVVRVPRLQLTAERLSSDGAYLLDDGETMILYVCQRASAAFLSETLGVSSFSQLADEARGLPKDLFSPLADFVERLNCDRPYPSDLLVLRDNSPSRHLFTERLVDDRVESAFSYYEFLQHIKTQVK